MNSLYNSLHACDDTNWIDFYILLSGFSKSLRDKNIEDISRSLVTSIHEVLCFAKQNDIDMISSWNRWKHKMAFKHYN